MKLIILCGGRGTRLRDLVSDVPKPLAPVGTRSFLDILIHKYVSLGFHDIVLSAGYLAQQIRDFAEKSKYKAKLSIIEEAEPLGTGGAVKQVLSLHQDDRILVVNGDTYYPDLDEQFVLKLDQYDGKFAIFGKNTRTPIYRFKYFNGYDGYLQVNERDDQRDFFLSYGMYLINRVDYLACLEGDWKFGIDDAMIKISDAGHQVKLIEMDTEFIDIGVPDDYIWFRNRFMAE